MSTTTKGQPPDPILVVFRRIADTGGAEGSA